MTLLETSYNLSQINALANEFVKMAKPYSVWALSGQLGAGKTTFTAAILKALGSDDHVSSPTFSLINHYMVGAQNVYHSDWYRIADEEEAIQSGIEDMLQQDGIKIVEWWERAPELLPRETLFITLELIDKENRSIKCVTKD